MRHPTIHAQLRDLQAPLLLALVALSGCASSSEKAARAFTGPEGCATRNSLLSSPDDSAVLDQGPSCPQAYGTFDDADCKKLQAGASCVVHARQQKDGPTVAEFCVTQTGEQTSIDGACSIAASLARNYLSVDDCKDRAKLIYHADANSDLLANAAGAAQTCRLSIKTIDPTDCVGKLHGPGICTVKAELTTGEAHNVCVRRDGARLAVDFRCSEGIASPSGAHRIIAKFGDKYDNETPAKDFISVTFTEQRQAEAQYAWIRKQRSDADRILGLLKGKGEGAQLTARILSGDKAQKTWGFEELVGEGWGETELEDSDDAVHVIYTSGRDTDASTSSFAAWSNSLVITSERRDGKVVDLATGKVAPLPGGNVHTTGATTVVDGKLIFQEHNTKNLAALDLKDGSKKIIVPLDPGNIRRRAISANSQGDVAWLQTRDAEYDDWSSALYVTNIRAGAKKPTKLRVFLKGDEFSSNSIVMGDGEVFVVKRDHVYGVDAHDPKREPRQIAIAEGIRSEIPSMVYASKLIALVDGKGVLVVDPAKPDSPKRIVSESECVGNCDASKLVTDGSRIVYFNHYRRIAEELDPIAGKTTRVAGWSDRLFNVQWIAPAFITSSGWCYVEGDEHQVIAWSRAYTNGPGVSAAAK
jgi:hypothetical protein